MGRNATEKHSKTRMVWYDLWLVGKIGSYFFKNVSDKNVVVNGSRYRVTITDYVTSEIKDYKLGDISFQQDVTTSRTSHQSPWSCVTKTQGPGLNLMPEMKYKEIFLSLSSTQ